MEGELKVVCSCAAWRICVQDVHEEDGRMFMRKMAGRSGREI